MTALCIRRDRTPVVLRKLAKADRVHLAGSRVVRDQLGKGVLPAANPPITSERRGRAPN
jgi:hypothetical protein